MPSDHSTDGETDSVAENSQKEMFRARSVAIGEVASALAVITGAAGSATALGARAEFRMPKGKPAVEIVHGRPKDDHGGQGEKGNQVVAQHGPVLLNDRHPGRRNP